MLENTVSRRNFLRGTAFTAAGALGASMLSGCTSGNSASNADWMPAEWTAETEVLVVGLGGAGSVAALTASELGSQVMVIEKAAHDGGGTSSCSGANVCAVQDADACYEYIKKALRGTTPDEILRTWADEAATIVDWLDEHEIGWTDRDTAVGFLALANGDENIARNIILANPDDALHAGGNYFIGEMRQKLEDAGVEIRYGHRANLLIQNPQTKEVLGVRAETESGDVYIRAKKGVILATGGFECNDQMMADYVRPYPLKPAGWPLNTGDGQIMAQKAGCKMWHMGMVSGSGYVFDEPDLVSGRTNFKQTVANNAWIFINRTGKRFEKENPSGYWSHISHLAYDTYDQSRSEASTEYRDIPFYCVFDETLFSAGALFPDTGKLAGIPLIPADLGGQDHTWSADNQEEIEMGWILKADTPEELANAINKDAEEHGFNIDGATLAETITRYNSMVESGTDTDFNRPASSMEALNNPPYYAMRFMPSIISTCGGPQKNEKNQLIDLEGNVIPRLYGAGVISHIASVTYPFGGTNWSEVFNGGRIAGRNCAGEVMADADEK